MVVGRWAILFCASHADLPGEKAGERGPGERGPQGPRIGLRLGAVLGPPTPGKARGPLCGKPPSPPRQMSCFGGKKREKGPAGEAWAPAGGFGPLVRRGGPHPGRPKPVGRPPFPHHGVRPKTSPPTVLRKWGSPLRRIGPPKKVGLFFSEGPGRQNPYPRARKMLSLHGLETPLISEDGVRLTPGQIFGECGAGGEMGNELLSSICRTPASEQALPILWDGPRVPSQSRGGPGPPRSSRSTVMLRWLPSLGAVGVTLTSRGRPRNPSPRLLGTNMAIPGLLGTMAGGIPPPGLNDSPGSLTKSKKSGLDPDGASSPMGVWAPFLGVELGMRGIT